jgi:TolA-binding protein
MSVRATQFLLIVLSALMLSAMSSVAQESRLYSAGKAAFKDGLYEVAEKQFQELLEKFPATSRREEVSLLLAQSQLNLGQWEDAVTILKNLLAAAKAPSKPADAIFWLAEAYSKGKQYADAETQYRALLTKFPKSAYVPQAEYGLAWALHRTKRSEDALKLFEKLAGSTDRSLAEIAQDARLAMGQVYLSSGEIEKAKTVFQPIADKTPPGRLTFEARYWMGESAYKQKEYADALEQFQKIVEQPKVWPSWVLGESWSAIGWIHWNKNEYEQSATAFEKAIQTLDSESKRRESAIQFGECYLRLGQVETAIEKLRQFVKEHPQDALAPDAQIAIADIYLSQKKFEEAAREYARLIADHPQHHSLPSARYWRGWALFELKRYEESIQDFQKAADTLRDEGQAAEAMYKIGDAYWNLGDHQKAIVAYSAFVEKHPDNGHVEQALFQIVQSQLHLKNTTQAKSTLATLVGKFPNSPLRDDGYLQIGLEMVKQGFQAQARLLYEDFLKTYPSSPLAVRAMLELGHAFYLDKLYPDALEQFDRVIAFTPPPPREVLAVAKYRRGLCLYQLEDAKAAVKEFTELSENYKDVAVTPEVQFRIGEFYYNQRNYAEAQRQWDILQKNHPNSVYADAALYWAGRAAYGRQGYTEAVQFFQSLLDRYPSSVWRPDARFWQAEALIEQGGDPGFQNALMVFDQLIRDYKTSDLVDDARGRKGDCYFTLKQYAEAIVAYRSVVDSPTANATQRNHARYQIGLCYEKMNRPGDALDQYMVIVYDQVADPEPGKVKESYWFCKAGLAAAAIQKQQDELRKARNIYQRLADADVPCSPEAQEQIRDIEKKVLPMAEKRNGE